MMKILAQQLLFDTNFRNSYRYHAKKVGKKLLMHLENIQFRMFFRMYYSILVLILFHQSL